jgi:hypothetical protein
MKELLLAVLSVLFDDGESKRQQLREHLQLVFQKDLLEGQLDSLVRRVKR